MSDLIAEWGPRLVIYAFAGVGFILSRYVYKLIESEWVRRTLSRFVTEVQAAVLEVAQTYADAIKEANADGKLTDAEKAEAKARAVSIAKSNIGVKGLRRLARIVGLKAVDKWLSTQVEATVKQLKPAPNP